MADVAGRYIKSNSGNVAMLFGLSVIPLLGIGGAAIDYGRVINVRASYQSISDAAALAGVTQLSRTGATPAEVERDVETLIRAKLPEGVRFDGVDIAYPDGRRAIRIEARFAIDTRLIRLVGINTMTGAVTSEARAAVDSAEISVALDLTGSMRMHVEGLREATRTLIDVVKPDGSPTENVRIALVPYVTTVNVAGHPQHMNWMDVSGRARYHGENFAGVRIRDTRCDPPPPPAPPPVASPNPSPPPPSNPPPVATPAPPPPPAPPPRPHPDLGFLAPGFLEDGFEPGMQRAGSTHWRHRLANLTDMVLELLGPGKAHASGWPYGQMNNSTPVDCDRVTPRVNHFDLFRAMNVSWKGCVEARPHPLDTQDSPPRIGSDDSYFVPYFWPDERDGNASIRNDYLGDYASGRPNWLKNSGDASLRRAWIWKYNAGIAPNLSERSALSGMSLQLGPNMACPDPIVPLTADRNRLLQAAAALRSYGASGTNIPMGLVWAWRMLSPNFVPEARPYQSGNRKFVILMTDGFNDIVDQNNNWNRSDYSGIGYVATRRLGSNDRNQIMLELDRRLTQVCNNIKRNNVEIFTVLYDPQGYTSSSQVDQLLRGCATSSSGHVFRAASAADLVTAFRSIGNQINALRLSR